MSASAATDAGPSELQRRLRALPSPRPMLTRDDLARLTDRQRELLAELGPLFAAEGFAELTMAEIANRLGCSLRTLYGLAPSRDELVLTVLDTHLWRIGREAMATVDPDAAPLDALRTYLAAATVALQGTTAPYARDLGSMAAAQRRNEEHADYLVAVCRALLDWAVERGDIAAVDTTAVARTLAHLGPDFIRPEVLPSLQSTPKAAADQVVDILIAGLPRPATTAGRPARTRTPRS